MIPRIPKVSPELYVLLALPFLVLWGLIILSIIPLFWVYPSVIIFLPIYFARIHDTGLRGKYLVGFTLLCLVPYLAVIPAVISILPTDFVKANTYEDN